MQPFMAESTTMLSKTASAPSLVKERRSATQALLRATSSGDIRAMRTLAIRCGAELSGVRCYNNEGNGAFELLAKMEHMTPQQKVLVKKQLIELPRLIGAHTEASTGAVTGAVTRGLRTTAVSMNASAVLWSPGKPKAQTLQERDQSVKFAMATLGETVGNPNGAYEAVLNKPRLLRIPPDVASSALKSLATTLRDEELAVRTVKKNSSLLEHEPLKYQQLVPVLIGILGAEETAYALTVRPELLAVDRPQLIRDAVQSMADSVGSFVDAMWLICQTLTPSSIKISTRAWVHEELGGTYLRLRGVRMHNRPVYKKPANSMTHHGSPARDMYLVFREGSSAAEDSWLITSSFNEKKLRVAANSEVAQVASNRTSPDQATRVWSALCVETGDWMPDPYLVAQDGKAPRSRGLLTVSSQDVRMNYNFLKEAVGAFWLEGLNGAAAEGTRFVGNLRKNDELHLGSSVGKFKGFGDFAPSKRFGYIQTNSAARKQPLVLQAWEPLSVYLLFDYEPVATPAEDKAPDPKGGKDDKKRGSVKDPAPAGGGEADPDATYWHQLTIAGWLPVAEFHTWKLPELSGSLAICRVLVRGFLRGRVEIPPHEGSGNPPLIFVRSSIAAESGPPGWACGTGSTCQCHVVARPGEALHNVPEPLEMGSEAIHSEAGPSPPKLDMVGEIGYAAGYSMIKPNVPDGPCPPSKTQVLIDTEDPIRVTVAWFHTAEPDPADGQPPVLTHSKSGRIIPPPPPNPPPWVAAQRWKQKEVSQPVAVRTSEDKSVTASYIYTRDFEAGEISIRGSDNAAVAIMWQALKDPRPHPLQKLLLRQPSLLASGSIFALLLKELRIELGIARARTVIMERMSDWSTVCETGGYDEVDAWVAERKMEAFGEDLRGIDRARSLAVRAPDLLHVTAPELTERCAVLEDGLRGKKSMLEAVGSLPELLVTDAKRLRRSIDALRSIFDMEATRRVGMRLPRLLLGCELLEALFARLQAEFPEVANERLQERSTGEWARWTEMVSQSGEVVATWLGRISAEERSLSSEDWVQLSGMHGKVRPP